MRAAPVDVLHWSLPDLGSLPGRDVASARCRQTPWERLGQTGGAGPRESTASEDAAIATGREYWFPERRSNDFSQWMHEKIRGTAKADSYFIGRLLVIVPADLSYLVERH